MERLKGKVAVVTGGTRGFGFEIAKAFIVEGASVVIASRSRDTVDQARDSLKTFGMSMIGFVCDVGDLEQTHALADRVKGEFGKFDIWVNNAAVSAPYGPTIHVPPGRFIETTNINILGYYYGSLVAMQHFLNRGCGKLINILGYGDRNPGPMQNAYSSSKAWVRNFSVALAKEYKDSGVGVFGFNPGMMDTDLLLNVEVIDGFQERLENFETVVQAISQPPSIPAEKVVWLASSATDGRTGLVVRESSFFRIMGGFLRVGINRLVGRKGRPVKVEVTCVPPAISLNLDKTPERNLEF